MNLNKRSRSGLAIAAICGAGLSLFLAGCGTNATQTDAKPDSFVTVKDNWIRRLFNNSKREYIFAHQVRKDGNIFQCWYSHTQKISSELQNAFGGVEDLITHSANKNINSYFIPAQSLAQQLESQKFWNTTGGLLRAGIRNSTSALACNSLALTALGAPIGPIGGAAATVLATGLCGLAGVWGVLDTAPIDGSAGLALEALANDEAMLSSAFEALDTRAYRELTFGVRKTEKSAATLVKCPDPTDLKVEMFTRIENR